MLATGHILQHAICSQSFALSRVAQRCSLFPKTFPRRSSYKAQDVVPSTPNPYIAVLYQAVDPPTIDGVRKLRKPGGT